MTYGRFLEIWLRYDFTFEAGEDLLKALYAASDGDFDHLDHIDRLLEQRDKE